MPKTHYIIPVFVPHLGCPYRCVFCDQRKIAGEYSLPTENEIIQLVDQYLTTIPRRRDITIELAFYGGSFTALSPELQQDLLRPAASALSQGKIHAIRLSTRPDCIDRQGLQLLSDYGVSIIELGVQSLANDVLEVANRGHTEESVRQAVALIKQDGRFKLGLQMMLGLPGDTREKSVATAKGMAELSPDFVRVYPTLVIKGTVLEQMYLTGRYYPLSLEEAVETAARVALVFGKAEIPIIRMGLPVTAELSPGGEIVAGPFHAAFHELVLGRISFEQIIVLVKMFKADLTGRVNLYLPEQDLSIVTGHRGIYLTKLKQDYPDLNFNLCVDRLLPRGGLGISGPEDTIPRLVLLRRDFFAGDVAGLST